MKIDADWQPRTFWAQVEDAGEVDTQSDAAEDSIDKFNKDAADTAVKAAAESAGTKETATDGSSKKKDSSTSTSTATVAAPSAPASSTAPELTKAQKKENAAMKVAGAASSVAGTQAAGYAQASGLSPAQAALMAGQQAGTNYNQAYGDAYMGLSQQEIQLKQLNQQNKQFKQEQQQQQNSNWMNLLGAGLSAGAALLFSDERVKDDIKDGYGVLARVTKVVGPKSFKYRGDNVERQGIMAQDLEKTPLAHTVVDTPDGKMVDTRQLTTANTGMITELSKKVDSLAKYFKGAKNG